RFMGTFLWPLVTSQPAPCRSAQPRRARCRHRPEPRLALAPAILQPRPDPIRLLRPGLMNMIPTIVFTKPSGAGTARNETCHAWTGGHGWAVVWHGRAVARRDRAAVATLPWRAHHLRLHAHTARPGVAVAGRGCGPGGADHAGHRMRRQRVGHPAARRDQ